MRLRHITSALPHPAASCQWANCGEPTTQGAWNTGHDLFRRSGSTYNTQPDISIYDQMKIDYASRL